MDVRDLDEYIERQLPLLELDLLAHISHRLAVLCHGVLGQQVGRSPEERERVIHALDCRPHPGPLSQVGKHDAAPRGFPRSSLFPVPAVATDVPQSGPRHDVEQRAQMKRVSAAGCRLFEETV
jgi:hypothetical protein